MTVQQEKQPAAGAAEWDLYWKKAAEPKRQGLYQVIAKFYRDQIISRSAAAILSKHFADSDGRNYLHAGCGSGGSDQRLPMERARFHFLDISPEALNLHRRQPMGLKRSYACGDIFRLPYASGSLDGLFNFGVMEHFTEPQISAILSEFRRVLKPDGRMVLFWPPDFGLSVLALGAFTGVANRFRKQPLKLHPDEVSRIHSFRWLRDRMRRDRLRLLRAEFGPGDLFTYVAVVAEKEPPAP